MAPVYRRVYGNQIVTLAGYDAGMRELIAHPMMHKGLKPYADAIARRAAATAPKRRPRRGETEREGTSYASSFKVETGIGRGKKTRNSRAYARVLNTKSYAFHLEFGTQYFTGRRTLRKAAGITRFSSKGDMKYG